LAPRWPQTGFQGFAPDCVMTPMRHTRALSTTTHPKPLHADRTSPLDRRRAARTDVLADLLLIVYVTF
jgi:hypothetical protein